MLNNSGHCHLTLLHSIPCRKLHVIHKQILNLSEYGQLTLAGDSFLLRTMAAILATWLVMCGEESTCSTAAITPPASRLHIVYSAHQTSQFMSGFDKRIFAVLWIQIPWIRIQNFGPIWIRVHRYVINFEEEKFFYRRTICL